MATPIWQAGTLYNPGAVVQRSAAPPVVVSAPTNYSFEDGNTGWDLQSGMQIGQWDAPFEGSWSVLFDVNNSAASVVNQNQVPVNPGQVITAQCFIQQRSHSTNAAGGAVRLYWYDASHVEIGYAEGNVQTSGAFNSWRQSSVSAAAPANAAYAAIGGMAYRNVSSYTSIRLDSFTWSYVYVNPPDGLVFKAVQADAGFSGTSEPAWPPVVGATVVDNEVTWEAVLLDRVIWTATPISKSSGTEPTWSTTVGGSVIDGTVVWEAVSRRVEDEKCPNSSVVAIAASKIYAVDEDIIPFSATVNPLDWSTANDAGYLPFGLQTYGANPAAALGLYRSNLVALNSGGMQMWQVDQDPTNMALLDAIPIGCTYPKSVQPVMNDLVLVTGQGIRSIGIAAASTNLQAGDFGKQIDPLVQAALAGDDTPIGLYVPSLGQYWAIFGAEAFVLTINGSSTDAMSWSRYVFPEAIADWTLLGDDLYLRTENDKVWKVTKDALVDDEGGADVEFEGRVWWNYLDLGELGLQKMMHGLDLVCTGEVAISIGYNQKNPAQATPDYTVDGDTVPGTMIPIAINAPSIQLRLTFSGNQYWQFTAASIYAQQQRRGS